MTLDTFDLWQALPTVLAVTAALGLWHVTAAMVRFLFDWLRGEAAKTPLNTGDLSSDSQVHERRISLPDSMSTSSFTVINRIVNVW